MKISASAGVQIITYALGSCLGITIHDPVARVGGMLHVMLPTSGIEGGLPISNPYKFLDTGLPRLFLESYKVGARKERLVVKFAGGASAKDKEEDDYFQIGKRNFLMLKKLLWKNGVLLKAHDVGCKSSRTMTLEIGTGEITLKIQGETVQL